MTPRGWGLFAAMCVIWGIPYLLIKVAVAELSPVTLVFLRTAAGALILLPIAAARGNLRPLARHWRAVLAYTVVEVGVPWLLLSDAERRLSSSLTGLLVATVPLVGALIAWLIRSDENLDARRVGGLVVGLAGVAALVGLDVTGSDLGSAGELGIVTVGYALGPVIVSRLLSGVPAIGVVAVSLGLTALVYAPAGVLQFPATPPLGWRVIAAVAGLAVVCTAVAFLVFFALIAEVGPVRATVITYFNPAVALILGVLVLHEALTVGDGVGFALILVGSVLATRRGVRTRSKPAMQADVASP